MSRKEEDWLSSSLSLCHCNGYFPSTNKLQPSFSSLCPYSQHFPHSSSHLFPGFWESPTVLLPEPTHSFKKHLLSAWYVPGTVLSVEDEVVNKAKSLPPWSLHPAGGWGRQRINMSTNKEGAYRWCISRDWVRKTKGVSTCYYLCDTEKSLEDLSLGHPLNPFANHIQEVPQS